MKTMKKTSVQFNVEFKKLIYKKSPWKKNTDFFYELVLKHIASDYKLIANSLDNTPSPKKEKYINYVETLKNLRQCIVDTVSYEFHNNNETEELEVRYEFKYYENEIASVEQIVEKELFDKVINSSYFLANDLIRLTQDVKGKEKEIKEAIKMYQHVGDFLTDAKKTLIIKEMTE